MIASCNAAINMFFLIYESLPSFLRIKLSVKKNRSFGVPGCVPGTYPGNWAEIGMFFYKQIIHVETTAAVRRSRKTY